jgi:hypothetical protein
MEMGWGGGWGGCSDKQNSILASNHSTRAHASSPSIHHRPQVTATTGDTLGPPWQAPENGYVLQLLGSTGKLKSLYYEPHCRCVCFCCVRGRARPGMTC